jgi:hypothetical protein
MMRLQVQPGWEPGITWDDHTYEPGETFNNDDEDAARQSLANGSAVEAPTKPKRSATKWNARPPGSTRPGWPCRIPGPLCNPHSPPLTI